MRFTTSVDRYNLTYLNTGSVYECKSEAGYQTEITDIEEPRSKLRGPRYG